MGDVMAPSFFLLNWITVTDFDFKKSSQYARLASSYFCVAFYSLILVLIIVIVNFFPEIADYKIMKELIWKDLPILENIALINVVSIGTILLGVFALILDLMYK